MDRGAWRATVHRVAIRKCQELARDIPLVTKVMRKEAWHSQRRDQASGVPLVIFCSVESLSRVRLFATP